MFQIKINYLFFFSDLRYILLIFNNYFVIFEKEQIKQKYPEIYAESKRGIVTEIEFSVMKYLVSN